MEITEEKFNSIKLNYGHCASWAVWNKKDVKECSNLSDLSIFEDFKNLKLKNNFILVGLTISGKIEKNFGNFHSNNPYTKDYKIRYSLENTLLYGSYMTDIIKDFEEKVSSKLNVFLRNNLEFEKENIKFFEKELDFIECKNPILIAFGNSCFELLNKYFKNKYKIFKVSHYSSLITKEYLRNEFLEIISKIEKNEFLKSKL